MSKSRVIVAGIALCATLAGGAYVINREAIPAYEIAGISLETLREHVPVGRVERELAAAGKKAKGADLIPEVKRIFTENCFKCHGQNGEDDGGFGSILDLDKLVEAKQIIPGDTKNSVIFARMSDGSMPPKRAQKRPVAAEIATVGQWIAAGAPTREAAIGEKKAAPGATAPGDADVEEVAFRDLQAQPEDERKFYRYISLAHLVTAGTDAKSLQRYRDGVSKLINSVSSKDEIALPLAVDKEKTLYRIDLRNYGISESRWDEVVAAHPFRVRRDRNDPKLAAATVRADWFLATASKPPLYHTLMGSPRDISGIENFIGVDVDRNIREGRVLRAGFNNSGVSQHNRMFERHATRFGYYWKSYDFQSSTGQENLFQHPFGPGTEFNRRFNHAGGEMIWSLPNGLQGYYLATAQGTRINAGPLNIVSDPRRPDRAVINGLSCFTCHVAGVIPKDDQLRPHFEHLASAGDVGKDFITRLRELYREKSEMDQAFKQDSANYLRAVRATGSSEPEFDPISWAAERFEAPMTARSVAAELGLRPEQLEGRLGASPVLTQLLSATKIRGGTVQRDFFLEQFEQLRAESELMREVIADGQAATKLGVKFAGGDIELLGYELNPAAPKAGEEASVTWYWKVNKALQGEFALFTRVNHPSGKKLDVDTTGRARQSYQPKKWRSGYVVRDLQQISIPKDWEPGTAKIRIGLWNPQKGTCLNPGGPEAVEGEGDVNAGCKAVQIELPIRN